MKQAILGFLLLMSLTSAWAQQAPVGEVTRSQEVVNQAQELAKQIALDENRMLIKSIEIKGFILHDKSRLTEIIKGRKNKRLSQGQIEKIVEDIRAVYWQEGYAGLISITDTVKKDKLIITVLLINT